MFKKISILTLLLILSGCGGDNSDSTTSNSNNMVEKETYPAFYAKYPRIVVKDVMARYFGTNEYGIVSYGIDDAVKAEGHLCPIVTGAYLITREGFGAIKEYYKAHPADDITSYDPKDGVVYRGGVKVTLGGKEGLGNAANAMAKTIGIFTGAKGASGFKYGPDYPFANRQNLLLQNPKIPFNPKTGIEVIFTTMRATFIDKDTNETRSYEQCEGLWGDCIEKTSCDKSFKITYKFKTPEVMGAAPKGNWPDTINFILENYQKAISVEQTTNPEDLCK